MDDATLEYFVFPLPTEGRLILGDHYDYVLMLEPAQEENLQSLLPGNLVVLADSGLTQLYLGQSELGFSRGMLGDLSWGGGEGDVVRHYLKGKYVRDGRPATVLEYWGPKKTGQAWFDTHCPKLAELLQSRLIFDPRNER